MDNWQTRATQFAQERNLLRLPGVYALDLMSELGEVAKLLLQASAYGERPSAPPSPQLADELGDVLYSLCLLATASGTDLEAAFNQTLTKYQTRWQKQGHLDSLQ